VAEDGGEIFLMVVWRSLSAVARVAAPYEQRENALVVIYEERGAGVLRFAEDDEQERW
jgi:hypothetical protein